MGLKILFLLGFVLFQTRLFSVSKAHAFENLDLNKIEATQLQRVHKSLNNFFVEVTALYETQKSEAAKATLESIRRVQKKLTCAPACPANVLDDSIKSAGQFCNAFQKSNQVSFHGCDEIRKEIDAITADLNHSPASKILKSCEEKISHETFSSRGILEEIGRDINQCSSHALPDNSALDSGHLVAKYVNECQFKKSLLKKANLITLRNAVKASALNQARFFPHFDPDAYRSEIFKKYPTFVKSPYFDQVYAALLEVKNDSLALAGDTSEKRAQQTAKKIDEMLNSMEKECAEIRAGYTDAHFQQYSTDKSKASYIESSQSKIIQKLQAHMKSIGEDASLLFSSHFRKIFELNTSMGYRCARGEAWGPFRSFAFKNKEVITAKDIQAGAQSLSQDLLKGMASSAQSEESACTPLDPDGKLEDLIRYRPYLMAQILKQEHAEGNQVDIANYICQKTKEIYIKDDVLTGVKAAGSIAGAGGGALALIPGAAEVGVPVMFGGAVIDFITAGFDANDLRQNMASSLSEGTQERNLQAIAANNARKSDTLGSTASELVSGVATAGIVAKPISGVTRAVSSKARVLTTGRADAEVVAKIPGNPLATPEAPIPPRPVEISPRASDPSRVHKEIIPKNSSKPNTGRADAEVVAKIPGHPLAAPEAPIAPRPVEIPDKAPSTNQRVQWRNSQSNFKPNELTNIREASYAEEKLPVFDGLVMGTKQTIRVGDYSQEGFIRGYGFQRQGAIVLDGIKRDAREVPGVIFEVNGHRQFVIISQ